MKPGLRALELGDEAVLDIDEFSLEGRAMRNVRQMVSGWSGPATPPRYAGSAT